MEANEVKKVKDSVDDLLGQLNDKLNEKGFAVKAVHFGLDDGQAVGPRFCYIDGAGRQICTP